MTLRNKFREFFPVVLLFVILNSFFISGRTFLLRWGASQDLLIGGNLFLFAVTFFSFLIAKKGLQNENPHAFVRAVYTAILVKFFLSIIAVGIYIFSNKSHVNKPGLFTLMGLYLVNTFVEVSILTRILKKKNE